MRDKVALTTMISLVTVGFFLSMVVGMVGVGLVAVGLFGFLLYIVWSS